MAPLRRGRRGGAGMTWLGDLGAELDRAGIHGATRRRIELELADHLACDPSSEARLGSPREVAERFAAELRTTRTRRAAWRSFFALALTAALLMVHARALSPLGSWSAVAGTNATFVSLGGLLLVLCAQIAFVAGVLAIRRKPTGQRRGCAGSAPGSGRAARRRRRRGGRGRPGRLRWRGTCPAGRSRSPWPARPSRWPRSAPARLWLRSARAVTPAGATGAGARPRPSAAAELPRSGVRRAHRSGRGAGRRRRQRVRRELGR